MFVDVYAIQNVPPCNINRDDTGSPKTAIYGGKPRARVSSQAWKHAMRAEFKELLPEESLGVRTKLAVQLIADKITELKPECSEKAQALAQRVLEAAGLTIKESTRAGEEQGSAVTEYLVFIARSEIESLAKLAISWEEQGLDAAKVNSAMKKEVEGVFHGAQAVDIALFGRMLADAPHFNTDASAQVAHAISVDETVTDYDYFTAMDDCAAEDNAGAAMLDTVAFNTSTLYRYATVDVDSLYEQLGEAQATAAGVSAFVEAFVRSMPTGKQNTFANRTLPNAVYVAMRNAQPVNAVSAFEVPVRAKNDDSISHQAAEKLGEKLSEFDEAYGTTPQKAWTVVVGEPVDSLEKIGESATLKEMLDGLYGATLENLTEEE